MEDITRREEGDMEEGMLGRAATTAVCPCGAYRDVLLGPAGEVVWEQSWQPNLIVNSLRSLLAALIKGDPQGQPLAFWAVGSGYDTWDTGAVPSDADRLGLTGLYAETGRKPLPPEQITFVGGSLTNRLEISAQFSVADIAGPVLSLREFGLFAGGSTAAGSGTLINHRIHPRIDLQVGFTLTRVLRLTL